MNLDYYDLKAGKNLTTFEFASEGPKGRIVKVVQFIPTNLKGLFNLAFGDKNIDTGQLDDMAVSNNGDTERILSTVTASVYAFTNRYPDVWVYATGSTLVRTRLYRMGILRYLDKALIDFDIFGEIGENWEPFTKGKNYDGFLVRRKKM